MATKSEEIMYRIQEQLKKKVTKYDDLIKDRRHADKWLIASLKKEMDHNKIRLET